MGVRESASGYVDAAPDLVFGFLTDVSRLPEWNRAISDVVDVPAQLAPGAVWRVRLHALGQSWVSRSEVSEIDRAKRHFLYRSQSDDGNPSYADWAWSVEPDGAGSMVFVTVDLNPVTFWRRHLLIKVRRPALRSEMHNSIEQLGLAADSR
jgi:uncharacterized protein YndB with AHSA1/START domain